MSDRHIENATTKPLPDGWQWVKLGKMCEVVRGSSPRPKGDPRFFGGDIPWVLISDVTKANGRFLSKTVEGVTELGREHSRFVGPGSLIVSNSATIGLPIFMGIGGCIHDGFLTFLDVKPELSLDWLFEFFRYVRSDLEHVAPQGAQKNLNTGIVKNLDVPLPPLAEQKRIAGILKEQMAAVERARRSAEAQLHAAENLPAAYLRAVFNSPEAESWERKPFGELVENFDGRRVPVKLDDRRNKKGQYPYYGASGIIDYVNDYLFDGEFLLIGEDGANLVLRSSPIAFKASGKFWVNNHAHVVQPKDEMPLDWLLYFFGATDLKPYVTGAAQPKLTQEDLNSIPVPVPPLADQRRIAAQLSSQMASAERLRQTLAEQLDAISHLPAALLRRAFNGEL